MKLLDLQTTYKFMYNFLGYLDIDSKYMIFGIEEANFNSNPVNELDIRSNWRNNINITKDRGSSYYHPIFPKEIEESKNNYWGKGIDIFSKILGRTISRQDIFYGDLYPFPSPSSSSLKWNKHYNLNIGNKISLYSKENIDLFNRRKQIKELILNGNCEFALFMWHEKEFLKTFEFDIKDGDISIPIRYMKSNKSEKHDELDYRIYEYEGKKLITIPHFSYISNHRLMELIECIGFALGLNNNII